MTTTAAPTTGYADAEWRTSGLVDESRTYEIWRTLGRTDADDYLGETVVVHPFAELRAALTAEPLKDVGGTTGGGKSRYVHAAIIAALATPTEEVQS